MGKDSLNIQSVGDAPRRSARRGPRKLTGEVGGGLLPRTAVVIPVLTCACFIPPANFCLVLLVLLPATSRPVLLLCCASRSGIFGRAVRCVSPQADKPRKS